MAKVLMRVTPMVCRFLRPNRGRDIPSISFDSYTGEAMRLAPVRALCNAHPRLTSENGMPAVSLVLLRRLRRGKRFDKKNCVVSP